MSESVELYNTVIKNGYCIGCGACALQKNSPFAIKLDEYGKYVAYPKGDMESSNAEVLAVCPFSATAKNEDEISAGLFTSIENHDPHIGNYLGCYAGYVSEGSFRAKGSSGGIAKWVGYNLLAAGMVDHFIQLRPAEKSSAEGPLFNYAIFSNKEEVLNGSKSSYYPVTLVTILQQVKQDKGRYAITGVPCFIRAIRLMCDADPVLKECIKYTIGIICGGMKSSHHSTLIGWELGIRPGELSGIEFRRKYTDRPASQKIYQVWSSNDSEERYRNANEIYGTDYGAGFFKPKACDYCDDVVGETADISIGDAWLPAFVNDPSGTSIIVVRNREIHAMLHEGLKTERIKLSLLEASDVVRSQSGGFRHRREALSMRLADRISEGQWVPRKRVKPGEFLISPERKKIYLLREKIAAKSHTAFLKAMQHGDLKIFHREMDPLVKQYQVANHGKFVNRVAKKIYRKLSSIKF